MTDEEILLLALGAGFVLLAVGVGLIVRTVRRRRNRRRVALSPAGESIPTAPPVVLGPPVALPPGTELPVTYIIRGLPLVVPRREQPLWSEKEWQRNGQGYEGQYRVGRHRWRGLIRSPYPGSFDAFIWNPPLAELAARTSHRPCFSGDGVGGRYKIHFHTMPESLDHAIASIEAVLAQAMGVAR